jgi:hypothetical protein
VATNIQRGFLFKINQIRGLPLCHREGPVRLIVLSSIGPFSAGLRLLNNWKGNIDHTTDIVSGHGQAVPDEAAYALEYKYNGKNRNDYRPGRLFHRFLRMSTP